MCQVSAEAGRRYDCRLLNAVVVYVGAHGVAQLRARGMAPSLASVAVSAHMDVFHTLTTELDYEGRYASTRTLYTNVDCSLGLFDFITVSRFNI